MKSSAPNFVPRPLVVFDKLP